MKHLEFLEEVKADPSFNEFGEFYRINFGKMNTGFDIEVFFRLHESFQLTALEEWLDSKGIKVSPCPLSIGWVVCIRKDLEESLWPIPTNGRVSVRNDARRAGIIKALELLPTMTT